MHWFSAINIMSGRRCGYGHLIAVGRPFVEARGSDYAVIAVYCEGHAAERGI